jgi:hypothetical protein
MSKDHEHGHDPVPANDNGTRVPVAAAAMGSTALTSLESLSRVFNHVNLAVLGSRTGLPLLLFKREGDGTYSYGQKRTVVEDGSRWALDPTSIEWGFICFGPGGKRLGEVMVPISQPIPDPTELPDKGGKWNLQWSANLKCLDGADAGVAVTFKTTTDGGNQAFVGLVDAIRNQINSGQHDGKVVPILLLEREWYPHEEWGKVWKPIFTIVDWMALDGPAPAAAAPPKSPPPPPAAPPPEQPRRRRRVA